MVDSVRGEISVSVSFRIGNRDIGKRLEIDAVRAAFHFKAVFIGCVISPIKPDFSSGDASGSEI